MTIGYSACAATIAGDKIASGTRGRSIMLMAVGFLVVIVNRTRSAAGYCADSCSGSTACDCADGCASCGSDTHTLHSLPNMMMAAIDRVMVMMRINGVRRSGGHQTDN
jgi:hypothetical protein